MIKDHDHLIKIILIGSSGVGKTSILTQFADNKFSDQYFTTIGVDFRFKTITHHNKNIKFQIWDTAGQERFRTITSAYYKGADGIIMVYDVTDPGSLEDISQFWVPQAYSYCDKSIDVLLLGNKSDCPSQINPNKIKSFLEKHKYTTEVVSAKMNDKVFESIKDFGLKIIEKRERESQKTDKSTLSSSSNVHINKNQSTLQYNKTCC